MSTRTLATVFTLAAALLLGACQSKEGGGINIGSGQDTDPVVVDFPVAYIKRTLPTGMADPFDPDLRQQRNFDGPADVYLRDRANPGALERNISARITNGLWDVRDIDTSWDGRKLVFAMRATLIPNADESEQPTWDIYEYDLAADTLRRVIASDIVAGAGHDVAPHYLPDGRIVFSSTRQFQARAVLIDEGKQQFAAGNEGQRNNPAFVLHVMNADGTGLRQISFNPSNDLDPAVMPDGRVLVSRWDNASGSTGRGMHLYTLRPDGSDLQLLYGKYSHNTGTAGSTIQFTQPRPRPDGRIMSLVRPFTGTAAGGDIVLIDATPFVDNTQAVAGGAPGGPAQAALTTADIRTLPGASPGGRYSSAFPLWDGTNRVLVGYTPCRLLDGTRIVPCAGNEGRGLAVAPPLYGVWIFDPRDGTQRPITEPVEGLMFTDIVSMQARTPLPPVILDGVPGRDFDATLASEGVGVMHIRSVYDFNGTDSAVTMANPAGLFGVRDPALFTAAQRAYRFVRLEKAVSLPDDEVLEDLPGTAFGVAGGLGMREILGYAPVEPDGSVKVKVPAGVAFQVTVLDANGRRVGRRHAWWMQVRAGETLTCGGCHSPVLPPGSPANATIRPHGRAGLSTAVNTGSSGGVFPNTLSAWAANAGETMAETRTRIDPVALTPSMDLVYEDVWTNPATAGRAADAPFALRYSALETPVPTRAGCLGAWDATCRSTIHYPDHIHPLWAKLRQVLDAGGAVIADRTCTTCHSPADAAGAVRVPAAQLDLGDGPSADEPDHLKSYRELMFPDNVQVVNMGALVDLLDPPLLPSGQPGNPVPVPNAPYLSGAGANSGRSAQFFAAFTTGTHAGYLTPAELRLVSEWLDLGGQYYNDPFVVPQN